MMGLVLVAKVMVINFLKFNKWSIYLIFILYHIYDYGHFTVTLWSIVVMVMVKLRSPPWEFYVLALHVLKRQYYCNFLAIKW